MRKVEKDTDSREYVELLLLLNDETKEKPGCGTLTGLLILEAAGGWKILHELSKLEKNKKFWATQKEGERWK